MLDKDNAISTSVSETVRRSLQMKKMIANAPSCVLFCTATAYKEQLLYTATDKHIAS